MTPAFRIFLLMAAAFAAAWVHHFRAEELRRWLSPPTAPAAELASRDPLVSPLGRVLAAYEEMGRIRMQGGYVEVPAPAPEAGVEGIEGDEDIADLPLVEDAPAEPGETYEEEPVETGSSYEGGEVQAVADDGRLELADPGDQVPAEKALEKEPPTEDAVQAPPEEAAPPAEIVHELRPGESLWKLAERLLGSGNRYREICELNRDVLQGRDPDKLPPGTKLRVRVGR